jgi:hypothetical protein
VLLASKQIGAGDEVAEARAHRRVEHVLVHLRLEQLDGGVRRGPIDSGGQLDGPVVPLQRDDLVRRERVRLNLVVRCSRQ